MKEESQGMSAACWRFEGELQSYLEGEARPFVAAHVRDCRSCSALLADLEEIRQVAGQMPREEPSRAVWANVRARLENEGVFRPQVSGWGKLWRILPHPVPVATLAGLVVLGAILTAPSRSTLPLTGPEVAETSAPPLPAPAVSVGSDSALASVAEQLESSFRAQAVSLGPDIKATYEKSLASLNNSIQECQESLQQEPGNTLAHEYLLTAYTRKAEILASALEFEGR